ncbi:Fc.00g009830.m01.CDS01 [Cosmosporella sp. VM-42]
MPPANTNSSAGQGRSDRLWAPYGPSRDQPAASGGGEGQERNDADRATTQAQIHEARLAAYEAHTQSLEARVSARETAVRLNELQDAQSDMAAVKVPPAAIEMQDVGCQPDPELPIIPSNMIPGAVDDVKFTLGNFSAIR